MRPTSSVLTEFLSFEVKAYSRLRRNSKRWLFRRNYSLRRNDARVIDVPVRGNGSVKLDIRPPVTPIPNLNRALVYLPSSISWGRPPPASDETQANAAALSALLPSSTVITINYRLDPTTQTFPLPVHDSFVAFAKIRAILQAEGEVPFQISVFGSEIGGSLATSLALAQPNLIHSVAVSEPVFNWVEFDDGADEEVEVYDSDSTSSSSRPSSRDRYQVDVDPLLKFRAQIFHRPETFFDPFASPMLFLRAPGKDCPFPNSKSALSSPSEPEFYGPYDDDVSTDSSSSSTASFESDFKPKKRRRVLRRWPDAGSEDARLPFFRVFSNDEQEGPALVLRHQAEDMVKLMRRACVYGVNDEILEKRVSMGLVSGRDSTKNGCSILGLEEAAKWLRKSQEASFE